MFMKNKMNIYIGNLSTSSDEDNLRQAFEEFGQVESVKIIKDRYTGESRGFAFVEMPTKEEALSAIEGLNDKEFEGSTLIVNEARPRSEGSNRGGRRRF